MKKPKECEYRQECSYSIYGEDCVYTFKSRVECVQWGRFERDMFKLRRLEAIRLEKKIEGGKDGIS